MATAHSLITLSDTSAADEPFDHNSPIGLTTEDLFHMSFSYICE
jgi:hypothetical protein